MQKLFGVTRWQDSRPNLFLFCKSKHSIFYKCLSCGAWVWLNARSVRVSPQRIQVQIVWEIGWITSNLLLGMLVMGSAGGFRKSSPGQCQLCVPWLPPPWGVFLEKGLQPKQEPVLGDEAIRAANCHVLCTCPVCKPGVCQLYTWTVIFVGGNKTICIFQLTVQAALFHFSLPAWVSSAQVTVAPLKRQEEVDRPSVGCLC